MCPGREIPKKVKEIIGRFNARSDTQIESMSRIKELGIPGGWATVARFIADQKDESDDFMVTLGFHQASSDENMSRWPRRTVFSNEEALMTYYKADNDPKLTCNRS